MYFQLDNLGAITNWQSGDITQGKVIQQHIISVTTTLRERGITPMDKVLIYHGGSAQFFVDLFGVWGTGACAVNLNPAITDEELRNICALIKPEILLVDEDGFLPKNLNVPSLCTSELADVVMPFTIPDRLSGHLDNDALILFTSGTTGKPKGVVHTFRSLLARVELNQAFIPSKSMVRTLCVLPTHFGHGLIGNCLTPLLAGHDLIMAPGGNLIVASELGAMIDKFGITFMSSVPTFWKHVIKNSAPPKNSTLQRIQVGSAPLSSDLWKNIIEWSGTQDVVNMYGITETANWLCGASSLDHHPTDGLIGNMWGGNMAVLTERGQLRSQGTGELLVQCASLFKEYFDMPNQTASVLKAGWFSTGDIGRIEADGTAYLTGRKKHEINRGGIKIHPEDIDQLLERHEIVDEACAFAIPDDIEGEIVGVAVSFVENYDADTKLLKQWCLERLVREKVPAKWFVVDELPKTDRGKLNRDVVAAHCLSKDQNKIPFRQAGIIK